VSTPKTAYFRFGPVRQETGDKHLREGDLVEGINVVQPKAGVYSKRPGFDRAAHTFVGGSLIGEPVSVVAGAGNSLLMRDQGDQLWSRAFGSAQWVKAGDHSRVWAETNTVQSALYTLPQPFSCVVGTSLWVFALATDVYEFTIVEAATGSPVAAKVTTTATGVVHASAAYDGTYVWVFWVDNGANGTVRCHRYTATTPTVAPVATNYYTFPSSPTNVSTVALQQVQARYFSQASKVFVVASGGSLVTTTYKRAAMHSVLDPATGLAVAAGGQAAATSIAYSGASGSHLLGGLCILEGQDGSGTYWYYSVVGIVDTDYTTNKVDIIKVTASTFTTITHKVLGVHVPQACSVAAFTNNATDAQYLIVSYVSTDALPAMGTTCYWSLFMQVNAGAITWTSTYLRTFTPSFGMWIASSFAQIGSRWYLITGFDDFALVGSAAILSEGNSQQRCFHVREFVPGASATASVLKIVSQFKVGQGPAIFHRAAGAISVPSGTPVVTCAPPLHAVGSILTSACSVKAGTSGYVDVAQIRLDTAKTYGRDCSAMGRGYGPGNIPVVWNGQCPVHEAAPLTFPSAATITGGSGSDFSIGAIVYAFYDADGTVNRSAPLMLNQTIGNGATIKVLNPTFYLPGTAMRIEIYLGNTATPKLQAAIVPSSAYLYTTWVTPTVAAMVNGEILYTTGGAFSQSWPVPCQAMAYWQNRLFLAQGNAIWVSKELEAGFAPVMTEFQVSIWSDEPGDITTISDVDDNALAFFAASRIAATSGQGPDGRGNGNYTLATLSTRSGIAAGGFALRGPMGCCYRDSQTGRLMAVLQNMQIVEVAGGAYDYSSYVLDSGVWVEAERLLVFPSSSAKAAIVLDYQHPRETAPYGQVYLWTFTTLALKLGGVDSSGMFVVDSAGAVCRIGTSYVDQRSGGTDTYKHRLVSAQLQLGQLQGEISISQIQTLLTLWASTGMTLTVYPGYASRTLVDARVTSKSIDLAPVNVGDAVSVMHRPSKCGRIQSVALAVESKDSDATRSFDFEGFAVEYTQTGNLMAPSRGKVI